MAFPTWPSNPGRSSLELTFESAASSKLVLLDQYFSRHSVWLARFRRDLQQTLARIGKLAEDPAHRGRHAIEFEAYRCTCFYEVTDEEVIVRELTFDPLPHVEIPPEKPAAMPRRFGIGTVLGLTLGFAVLHMALKYVRVPTVGVLSIVGLFVAVAAGQALLFGGKRPRTASALVGVGFALLAGVVFTMMTGHVDAEGVVCLLPTGAFMGYVAGGLVAALFLKLPVRAPEVSPLERREPSPGQS